MRYILICFLLSFCIHQQMFAQNTNEPFVNKNMHKTEKKGISFIGSFYKEIGPKQYYEENKTRSRLITGFTVVKDLSQNIKVTKIEFEPSVITQLESDLNIVFIPGELYKIELQPDKSKQTYITNENIKFDYYKHLISSSEIVSIELDSTDDELPLIWK